MKYCLRCGAEFKRKDYFEKHLQRKYICELKYLNVSREEISKNYDVLFDKFDVLRVDKNYGKKQGK